MARRWPFSAGPDAAFDGLLARWLPGPCRLRSLAPPLLPAISLQSCYWSCYRSLLHHGNHRNDPLSSAVFTTKLCFKALSLIPKWWMQGHTFATTPGLAPGLTYPLLSTLPIPQPFSSSSLIPPCSYLSPPAPRFPTNSGVPHPDPSTLWLLENTAKQYRTISNMPQNITSKWKTTLMFWNWLNESTARAAKTC